MATTSRAEVPELPIFPVYEGDPGRLTSLERTLFSLPRGLELVLKGEKRNRDLGHLLAYLIECQRCPLVVPLDESSVHIYALPRVDWPLTSE